MTQSAKGFKTVFQTALTDQNVADIEGVGTLRQEGDKWYRWVKFEDAVTAAGVPVTYDFDAGEDMHEAVYTPVTANLYHFAGLSMCAVTEDYYAWIMIEGWHGSIQVSLSNTALSIGQVGFPANTASYFVVGANVSAGYSVTMASNATSLAVPFGMAPARIELGESHATSSAAAIVAMGGWVRCLFV
jgi:hypothetical protein